MRVIQVFDAELSPGDGDDHEAAFALTGYDLDGRPVRVVANGPSAKAVQESVPWSGEDGPCGRYVAVCVGTDHVDQALGGQVFVARTVSFVAFEQSTREVARSVSARVLEVAQSLAVDALSSDGDVEGLRVAVLRAMRTLGDVAFALVGPETIPPDTGEPRGSEG